MGEASLPREILHREGFYPEESSGLFVGISSFDDDRFAAVPFAVDDAVDLAWVFALHLKLLDPGRTVLALAGEPRKQISQERLAALLQAGAKKEGAGLMRLHRLVLAAGGASGPRGLFVLTAATHGLADQGGDYLVATDSVRDSLLDTALKLPTLFDRIAQLPAKRRLVLLDACRERLTEQRSVGEADPAMAASFAAAIGKAVGQTVLMGSVAGGYTYDDTKEQNGVFSGALVAGLCGAAQADVDGLIKVCAVAAYARERVQAFVRQHRPEHAGRSRGIEERYDENARELPLAIDPARARALEVYRVRRAAAVEQLHRNIGGDLDGHRFQDITDFLPLAGVPSAEVGELLTEIEALDGSERSKRSVLFLFEKLRPPKVPAPPPPVAPGSRSAETWPARKWLVGVILAVSAVLLVVRLGLIGQPVAGSSVKLEQPKENPTEQPVAGPSVKPEQLKEKPTEHPVAEPSVKPAQPKPTEPPKVPEPKPGAVMMTDSFGQFYRWVPAGKYSLGRPSSEARPDKNVEKDPYKATLAGFWLAETELTQAFWSKYVQKNPSYFSGCDQCPVENVSWWEAVSLANILSDKAQPRLEQCYELACSGELGTAGYSCKKAELKKGSCNGYRLPSDEEWEAAARGDGPYEVRYGPLDKIAWHVGNSKKPQPVGGKDANKLGFKDLLGNVWEWTGSSEVSGRTFRGGAFMGDDKSVRAASRGWLEPGKRDKIVGFRFVLGRLGSSQGEAREGATAGH